MTTCALFPCRIRFIALPFLLAIALFSNEYASAQGLIGQVRKALKERTTIKTVPHGVVCKGELLCGSVVLPRFYSLRDFSPAWLSANGPRPEVTNLVQAISQAHLEGLSPQDYHLSTIESLLEEIRHNQGTTTPIPVKNLVDLDLLLTDAFLLYASHLSAGRVNPETLRSEWFIKIRKADLVQILNLALAEGSIEAGLDSIRPKSAGYANLKKVFMKYNTLLENGDWPGLAEGPTMKKGDRGPRIAALRSRLAITGDLEYAEWHNAQFFDEVLEKSVLKFQYRNGLKQDALVGKATLAVLNVPLEERTNQIKLNMERWRWLPQDFGSRYLLVNIADFRLTAFANSSRVLSMPVVVGKKYRRTPVFSGKMTYMVVNPYWNIPPKIAGEDFLPRIKKNPDFFQEQGIRVYESWEERAREVDLKSLDWGQVTEDAFPYKLRQDPGPLNALGRIKFIFPNKYSVYLHDTPAKALFEKQKRTFSSGCIRISRPVELAVHLLGGHPHWTRERILQAMNGGETRLIWLPEPIDIQILYFTAWVDGEGMVHFRDDIYERDRQLDRALRERPPGYEILLE